MTRKKRNTKPQWKRVDLHLHTPASADYQEPNRSYLDIIRQAENKGLDIIAFTDHNTIAGYQTMLEKINQLKLLEQLGRIQQEEKQQLKEYRRLREKVLVLPGFEFTATLGFHILGIFSPEVDVRELEFILRQLNIPLDKLDAGSGEVGATTDVLTAYRVIDEAGGIVIAAHVNSSHGVAMRRSGLGGQTRMAYTQDPHLHALEATDLENKGRRTTARFFDGSRPEYPRPMRCIQGSDAHRLTRDGKHLGVGERVTEVLLPEVSFDALREVFLGNDFALTRPYRPATAPLDHIQAIREEGDTIVQAFHVGYTRRGGRRHAILADVCSFANTNGGAIYIGVSANPKEQPAGVRTPSKLIRDLQEDVERRITPPLDVNVDMQETQGKKVVRLVVPRGDDPPYAIDDNKIYVRSEGETDLAVRDEIVSLVKRVWKGPADVAAKEATGHIEPPRTGVEIVESQERKGTLYHTMRDLRNGNQVKNVTRKSARRLWHYAITQAEEHPVDASKVEWHGDIAVLKQRQHRSRTRYDLVQRENGKLRAYYGVTEDGIHGEWAQMVGLAVD
ncbi:MAG: transcriptional regulator [Chloroflexi bacterium]|nr:MAG: transcriptional regulator [Anaerolineaceae bacterium 4572_32.2]RLC75345.1 MAG: transcriptional regulator [Chloroflexota bacterium]RLC87153.1 MAG: transcriptional regulator [Chloroflexota bacterium]HEY72644.1 PHP domain-containing protein [Thermoflexia bacterium]